MSYITPEQIDAGIRQAHIERSQVLVAILGYIRSAISSRTFQIAAGIRKLTVMPTKRAA